MKTMRCLMAAVALVVVGCGGGGDASTDDGQRVTTTCASDASTAQAGGASFHQAAAQPVLTLPFVNDPTVVGSKVEAATTLRLPASTTGMRVASGRVVLRIDGAAVDTQPFSLEAAPGAGATSSTITVQRAASAMAAGTRSASLVIALDAQAGAVDASNVAASRIDFLGCPRA